MKKSLPIVGQTAAPAAPAPGHGPRSYEAETQAFSTWGDKLLQHADVLHEIQARRTFKPITVQLAPTEACDSDCPFCSVGGRPVNKRIPWLAIEGGLRAFRALGAKSVEITGGGNPLLYRDGARTINDVVDLALGLGLEVGIISNSERPLRHLRRDLIERIDWLRLSLIKLDEGKAPADFELDGIPPGKLAFSYIVYEGRDGKPGTTPGSIERIAELVDRYPAVKFVRLAADCLTEDSLTTKERWGPVVEALDRHGKFFIKEIGGAFHPYTGGCWVGMLRPYWVHDGVYICTSHVLKHRTYHPTWKLCGHGPGEIRAAWDAMNARFGQGLPPYPIDIAGECFHCYYRNNNQLLHAVVRELPDKNFA